MHSACWHCVKSVVPDGARVNGAVFVTLTRNSTMNSAEEPDDDFEITADAEHNEDEDDEDSLSDDASDDDDGMQRTSTRSLVIFDDDRVSHQPAN